MCNPLLFKEEKHSVARFVKICTILKVFTQCSLLVFPVLSSRNSVLKRSRTCTTFSQYCSQELGKTFLMANLDNYSNKILFVAPKRLCMSQMGEKLAQGIVERGFQCLELLLAVTQQLYKFRLICSLRFDIRSNLPSLNLLKCTFG